jgi:N-acetyl-anhydromuramyl-L-alanine amidase AmpD
MIKKIIFAIFLSCFLFPTPTLALLTPPTQDEIIKMVNKPTHRIKIPGITYSEIKPVTEGGNMYLYIPYIGEYFGVVYRYLVIVAGVIAVIVLIVSGMQWTASGGNSSTIDSAKHRIISAITGLVLAVGSYVILYVINPELVAFRSLKIKYIPTEQLDIVHGETEKNGGPPCTGERQPSLSANIGYPSFEVLDRYACGNRDLSKIKYLVLHEGTRVGSVETIQFLATRGLSTHFQINQDGGIKQGVDLRRTAWHAGSINAYAVGVDFQMPKECTSDPECASDIECSKKCVYSDAVYASLNKLINVLTSNGKTGIVKDDAHIIAHCQVWDTTHGDPRNLDWTRIGLNPDKHREKKNYVNGPCVKAFTESDLNALKAKKIDDARTPDQVHEESRPVPD